MRPSRLIEVGGGGRMMTTLHDIGFTRHVPRQNRRHFVTEDEIRVVLSRLPEGVQQRLRWVHLNDGFGRLKTLGYVNRGHREIGLCAAPPRISLGAYLRRNQTVGQFGAISRCQWPTLAVRRFFLYDVLLHELGHLQVIDVGAKNLRRKFANETRAQEFADHWCRELWSRPFDHPDPVHNPPTRDELDAVKAGWARSWDEFQQGRRAEQARRHDEARQHFERAVEHYGANSMALERLGVLCYRQGTDPSIERAIAVLTEAVRLDPALPDAHLLLAMGLSQAGRKDEARRAYQRAIQLDPYGGRAMAMYADSLAEWECHEEAGRLFAKVLKRRPQSVGTICNWGRCLAGNDNADPKEIEQAIGLFQRAVSLDPSNADSHYWLGVALLDFRSDIEQATFHLEQAIRLEPSHSMAADALEEIKKMAEQDFTFL